LEEKKKQKGLINLSGTACIPSKNNVVSANRVGKNSVWPSDFHNGNMALIKQRSGIVQATRLSANFFDRFQ